MQMYVWCFNQEYVMLQRKRQRLLRATYPHKRAERAPLRSANCPKQMGYPSSFAARNVFSFVAWVHYIEHRVADRGKSSHQGHGADEFLALEREFAPPLSNEHFCIPHHICTKIHDCLMHRNDEFEGFTLLISARHTSRDFAVQLGRLQRQFLPLTKPGHKRV